MSGILRREADPRRDGPSPAGASCPAAARVSRSVVSRQWPVIGGGSPAAGHWPPATGCCSRPT